MMTLFELCGFLNAKDITYAVVGNMTNMGCRVFVLSDEASNNEVRIAEFVVMPVVGFNIYYSPEVHVKPANTIFNDVFFNDDHRVTHLGSNSLTGEQLRKLKFFI